MYGTPEGKKIDASSGTPQTPIGSFLPIIPRTTPNKTPTKKPLRRALFPDSTAAGGVQFPPIEQFDQSRCTPCTPWGAPISDAQIEAIREISQLHFTPPKDRGASRAGGRVEKHEPTKQTSVVYSQTGKWLIIGNIWGRLCRMDRDCHEHWKVTLETGIHDLTFVGEGEITVQVQLDNGNFYSYLCATGEQTDS